MNVDILKATWRQAHEKGDELPQRFYASLFAAHPEARALFPSPMAGQRDRFVRAMTRVVADADRLDRHRALLRRLGVDHRRYGAQPVHYGYVLDALLDALSSLTSDEWTDAHTDAWAEAFEAVASVMKAAADEQAAAGVAPWWDAEVAEVQRRGAAVRLLLADQEVPKGYEDLDGLVLDVAPVERPGMWSRALVTQAPGCPPALDVMIRGVDFPGMALGALTPGARVRIGPPEQLPQEDPQP